MRYVRLIIAAAAVVVVVAGVYVYYFYFKLGYLVSKSTDSWAQFGDYFGGVVNPLLSFFALICLIQSLSLQNQANRDLRNEILETKKYEKFRAFNLLFFNIIEAQKSQIGSLSIRIAEGEDGNKISGIDAILWLEAKIEKMREEGVSDQEVHEYIETVDYRDCIFGILRAFYLAAKLVDERLSDGEGFSIADRVSHYQTLVNFTDFTQLRLVMIAVQFSNGHYAAAIKENLELQETLKSIGMSFDIY